MVDLTRQFFRQDRAAVHGQPRRETEAKAMEKTVASRQGTVRFLIFLIAVLVLLNIGYYATWNEPQEAMTSPMWPDISLSLGLSGLKQPTHITHANDDSNRLFITEQ